jgi:hypothetical protein
MRIKPFRHWTSSVPARIKLERVLRYPQKLKKVVGDPRSRFGGFFPAVHGLASRYANHTDLTPCEYRVFSQHGEDGIIAEIVRRIGPACPRSFVEFGAGAGTAGNTIFLADVLGWQGLFIEPAADDFALLESKYQANDRVKTICAFVGPENINELLQRGDLRGGIGVLSIDVDGNDYYVWQAITVAEPALIVIEYNGALPLKKRLVQPLMNAPWTGTDYFGASLGALVSLGAEKGYFLAHTDLAGLNAFFVHERYRDAFRDLTTIPQRTANYELIGIVHPHDRGEREYIDLDAPAAPASPAPPRE